MQRKCDRPCRSHIVPLRLVDLKATPMLIFRIINVENLVLCHQQPRISNVSVSACGPTTQDTSQGSCRMRRGRCSCSCALGLINDNLCMRCMP